VLQRVDALSRLFVLSDPMSLGPRTVGIYGGQIVLHGAIELPAFDLIIVDEAHHVYRQPELASIVNGLVTSNKLVLLSDISQSHEQIIAFPPVDKEAHISEIVRSSQRIVMAAMAFQINEQKDFTQCHHTSQGPPVMLRPPLERPPRPSHYPWAPFSAALSCLAVCGS
jgi:hypothetical protein